VGYGINGDYGVIGSPDAMLMNQGTINADTAGGNIMVNSPGGLSNQGTLEATNGGVLSISTFTNQGSIAVDPASSLTINGAFTQTAGLTTVQGLLTINGNGVTISGGNVDLADGRMLVN
jgi:hypothetical protein